MNPERKVVTVPRLRQDLKLYPGPKHRDGSPSWRILDPVRNRFYEIGWLEFELLARFPEHQDADSLIAQVAAETPIRPSEEEVSEFISFLVNHQLVIPEGKEALGRLRSMWMKADHPLYERIFHGYLSFRLPLFRPDRFLRKTLPVVDLLYTRVFASLVLVVFLADLYLLTREWEELQRSFAYFFSLQGGLLFLIAATFSKIIHEFGHAYTAKRYGVRVPVMGVAFLVMWPFLYTDTGEVWKLADQKKQLHIASAGILAELVVAIFATLFWAISPEGAVKYMLFVLATTTWVMTLAINASPFMRFDGYFLLSDALDFPNLHERSFACARWWIRGAFFRLREPLPEPSFTARQRVGLVVFALIVWIYRLVVFFGIALLVYHMFIKLLGIVLMLLEIVWFIIRPVWSEVNYLWTRRALVRIAPVPFAGVLLMLLVLIYMLPVSRELSAPAVLRTESEQPIYAPFPARIVSVEVKAGQLVEEGQLLFRLELPELRMRAEKAASALVTARAEFLRAAATSRQTERREVLLGQIAAAIAEQESVRQESERLEVRAGMRGVVRDMGPQIMADRWINSRELLARLVSPWTTTIEAYIGESRIDSVSVGQKVTFIPSVLGASVVKGRVMRVDATGSRQIGQRVLVSPYGGSIPAVLDRRGGGATAHDLFYRVLIEPEPGERKKFPSVMPGTAHIGTTFEVLAQNFISRGLSLLVREAGI